MKVTNDSRLRFYVMRVHFIIASRWKLFISPFCAKSMTLNFDFARFNFNPAELEARACLSCEMNFEIL